MGLKLSTNFRGVDLPEAYLRVTQVTVTKDSAVATVGTFASESAAVPASGPRNCNALAYTEYPFTYDLTGSNPIEQAYVFVKTQPEFEGAIDLLDE
jgi:hypothetical protein